MVKPVTIIVYPSGTEVGDLTIADAMQQVLDAFALLSSAEAVRDGDAKLIWKLDSASTESPLMVQGSAISNDPGLPIDLMASQAASTLYDGLSNVLRRTSYASWLESDEGRLRGILNRSVNGVGRTDFILLEDNPPVVLSHRIAFQALAYLDQIAAAKAANAFDLTRTEYGSVEGYVAAASTWYGKPSLVIKHRLSGKDITCVCGPHVAIQIGPQYNWAEIWARRRVLVSGAIHYNFDGDISRIDFERIAPLESPSYELEEFAARKPSAHSEIEAWLERAWGTSDA